jgi:hypothetical protein
MKAPSQSAPVKRDPQFKVAVQTLSVAQSGCCVQAGPICVVSSPLCP